MFIKTTSEAEAEGKLREIYEGDRKSLGYVPNHAKVFSLRPDVLEEIKNQENKRYLNEIRRFWIQ